jgi:hypothetical protein
MSAYMLRTLARLAPSLVPILLLGLSGCGTPTVTIKGEVKYKGKLLPAGRVTFYDADGKNAKSSGIHDGAYTITDLPAGPATITVQTFPPPKGKVALPKGVAVPMPEGVTEQPAGARGPYVRIPPRYGAPRATDLHCTVTPGEQTHNIDLAEK